MTFSPGDIVTHVLLPDSLGEVKSDDGVCVRVKWEDGKTGHLYREPGMVPHAQWLQLQETK